MKTGELRAMRLRSQLQHVKKKTSINEQSSHRRALARSLSRRLYQSIARKAAHLPGRLISAPEGGQEVWGEGFVF